MNNVGFWSDEFDSCFSTIPCKLGVLGKEAVAGVDRIGAALLSDSHNLRTVQIDLLWLPSS